jgi:hypothetical protein
MDLAVKSALEGTPEPLCKVLRRRFDDGTTLLIGLDLHDASERVVLTSSFRFIVKQPKEVIAMVHQKLPFQMKVAPGDPALLRTTRWTDQGGRRFEEGRYGRLGPATMSVDVTALGADGRFRGGVIAAMSPFPIGDLPIRGDVGWLHSGCHGVPPQR